MTIVITLPDEISDETAAHIVDLCYQLGHVLEGCYSARKFDPQNQGISKR